MAPKTKAKRGTKPTPSKSRTPSPARPAMAKPKPKAKATHRGLLFGKLGAVTIHVQDYERAIGFYEDTLGLKVAERADDMKWAAFDTGNGVPLSFHAGFVEPGGRPIGTPTGFVFHVKDVDATVSELRTRGAKIVDEPEDMPWGARVATVADPDGNTFVVSTPG
jgi:lactoylglutathione lyase